MASQAETQKRLSSNFGRAAFFYFLRFCSPLDGVNQIVYNVPEMGALSDQLRLVAYSAAYATGRERFFETLS